MSISRVLNRALLVNSIALTIRPFAAMARCLHILEAPLFKACASSGEEVCKLKPCDVVDVVEGPRQEPTIEVCQAIGK